MIDTIFHLFAALFAHPFAIAGGCLTLVLFALIVRLVSNN